MTYTYDSTSLGTDNVSTIRFLLQDTNEDEHYLEDEEIGFLYGIWFDIYKTYEYVASVCADIIAARYSREASISADGVSVSLGPIGDQYRQLAAALREQHNRLLVGGVPDVGGITPGEGLFPGIRNFSFGIGMDDDIEAGRQNYGSREPYYYPPEWYPGY